jgi:hypothetical protein
MRVCLLSFGRSYKTRHSDEFHKSYGFHPKNAGNCPLEKLERQDSFSCRSIATDAIDKMSPFEVPLVNRTGSRLRTAEGPAYAFLGKGRRGVTLQPGPVLVGT